MNRRNLQMIRESWQQKVVEQKSSGLPASRWCREHQVQYKSFLYWKNRFSPHEKLSRSCFQELTENPVCEVQIEYEGIKIALSGRVDPSILSHCVRALKSC